MLFILDVLKVHTGPSIQSNVTHVKGVEIHSMCEILYYEQRIKCYVCQRRQKCIQGPSIQSNVTHVRGVESAYIFAHNFLNIQNFFWIEIS